jgi:hypothetical protein
MQLSIGCKILGLAFASIVNQKSFQILVIYLIIMIIGTTMCHFFVSSPSYYLTNFNQSITKGLNTLQRY